MIEDFLLYFFIVGGLSRGVWLAYCAMKTENRTPFIKSLSIKALMFGGTDDANKSRSLLIIESVIFFLAGSAFLYLLL